MDDVIQGVFVYGFIVIIGAAIVLSLIYIGRNGY